MKKHILTLVVWIAILYSMLELNILLKNMLVAVADVEVDSLQLPLRRNYLILLILNSMIYLIGGIILRMRVKFTTTACFLALGLGISYFTLVEMYFGSNIVYIRSHGTSFDGFLTFAPLLAPVVFITLGALVFSIWIRRRSDSIEIDHPNNSFKVARKKRGLDAAQKARSAT